MADRPDASARARPRTPDMTDRDTIARLRAEQQHAARLGPDPSDEADYWEPMPHLTVEDWSARIREAEQAAEWLEDDERDRWPSGWYIGWLIIIALAALLVLAAWGLTSAAAAGEPLQPRMEWVGQLGTSYVEIAEPETPDTAAVAVVTFRNEPVHRGNAQFAIALGGIVLDVIMEWQVDGTAERITVLPRGAFIAMPAEITVPERAEGRIMIYPATS